MKSDREQMTGSRSAMFWQADCTLIVEIRLPIFSKIVNAFNFKENLSKHYCFE